LTCAL